MDSNEMVSRNELHLEKFKEVFRKEGEWFLFLINEMLELTNRQILLLCLNPCYRGF